MTLRRRLRELEERVEALEVDRFNGEMPPRPDIGSEPVDAQALWRVSSAETVIAYDPSGFEYEDWSRGSYI